MDYLRIFKGLREADVDFLLVGGLAVNLHGVPRMTYDVDLLIDLGSRNVEKAVGLLETWGFRPRVPVDPLGLADPATRRTWREEKNMRALSFFHDRSEVGEIDILLDGPAEYALLKGRAATVPLGDLGVPVISREDLIAMKTDTGRAQDRADVEALETRD